MVAMPGQEPVELIRFPYSPAAVDLAPYTRDFAPEWIITVERTLLDVSLLSPRPKLGRHYAASERERTAIPTADLGPLCERYADQDRPA